MKRNLIILVGLLGLTNISKAAMMEIVEYVRPVKLASKEVMSDNIKSVTSIHDFFGGFLEKKQIIEQLADEERAPGGGAIMVGLAWEEYMGESGIRFTPLSYSSLKIFVFPPLIQAILKDATPVRSS